MKKIFLYAYDRANLGDDLFVHTIANRYPDVRFYLWSTTVNKATFSCLKNVVVLDQDSRWIRLLRTIRASLAARHKVRKEERCDAVVYIGGSLFIEYDNWQTILLWWDYEAKNRNFYVLGANFGPYHTEEYRKRLAEIFSKMKDVCFRDKYSQSLFTDVSKVRCAPDILFSYPMKKNAKEKKQVFVSMINCAVKDEGANRISSFETNYLQTLVALLQGFAGRRYSIILSSFCKEEGDEKTAEKIRGLLPEMDITMAHYNGTNSNEILEQISESEFVIASRFHAAILGFVAGKPVLPLIYSDKTKHVLEDAGFKGKYLDIRRLGQTEMNNGESSQSDIIETFVDELLNNPRQQQLGCIEQLKDDAENHFVKLDLLLKR